jgi:hypothetical protein
MCRQVPCLACAQPTWEGCGQHVEATLAEIPAARRCPGWSLPGGTCGLARQRVANDGACLFYAIDLIARSGSGGAAAAADAAAADASPRLRSLVAGVLAADPAQYTPEVLGAPLEAYTAELLQETTHGGEVELSVLAGALGLCLAVVDLTTPPAQPVALRLYNAPAPRRGYLLYTGSHYDPLRRGSALAFEGAAGCAALAALDENAPALGARLRALGEGAPRPAKRVRCCACQAVVAEAAFAAHCSSQCPAEDNDFMCEPVVE